MDSHIEHIYRRPSKLQNEIKEKYENNPNNYALVEVSMHSFYKENRYYFLVDKEDKLECLSHNWCLQLLEGYNDITFHVVSTNILMHEERYLQRFILERKKEIPKRKQVKFLNINQFDCSKENLEITTRSSVLATRRADKNTSSIFKGVCSDSQKGSVKRWRTGLTVEGKTYTLGCYINEIEAAFAYNIAIKYFYPRGCLMNSNKNGVIGYKYLDRAVKTIHNHIKEVGFSSKRFREIIKLNVYKISQKNSESWNEYQGTVQKEYKRKSTIPKKSKYIREIAPVIMGYFDKNHSIKIPELANRLNEDGYMSRYNRKFTQHSCRHLLQDINKYLFQ
ncbi:MAG: hypothetical protein P8M55_04235 [Gammaproteobacteria bacterium]|nr:hypothetical protein [Gammaproteobacteria bacterium]